MSLPKSENAERLRDWQRFVIWKYDGKNKEPIDPRTGREISWTDPSNWMGYQTARRKKLRCHSADGIGFVLDETPFSLADFDHCFVDGPEGKEITPFASEVLSELDGVKE